MKRALTAKGVMWSGTDRSDSGSVYTGLCNVTVQVGVASAGALAGESLGPAHCASSAACYAEAKELKVHSFTSKQTYNMACKKKVIF